MQFYYVETKNSFIGSLMAANKNASSPKADEVFFKSQQQKKS